MKQAVILAGGKGTRLGDITKNFPKPLLDINGRPFLTRILDRLSNHGITDVLLLAGYGVEHLIQYFSAPYKDLNISIHKETEAMGTAGAIRNAALKLQPYFLLLNGDSIFDCNFSALKPVHDSDTVISMALRSEVNANRYGQVDMDDTTGYIRSFKEKESQLESSGLINTGIYFVNRDKLLPYISGVSSLEVNILPHLVTGSLVKGVIMNGYFIDIGIPSALQRAKRELDESLQKPVVVFDRDNTLVKDKGYTYKISDLDWVDGAVEAITKLNNNGYLVTVATNQAGIARGYYTEADMHAFHMAMQDSLLEKGGHIDGFYFCPHHVQGTIKQLSVECSCRKPKTGMLEKIYADFNFPLNRSVMVGDAEKDIQCANDFGIKGIQYSGGSMLDFLETSNIILG